MLDFKLYRSVSNWRVIGNFV